MLEVKDLVVAYGKIKAVKGISFSVDEGEVVTLIGTNGAGKTTTLRTISGLLRPASGSIRFQGKRIDDVAAHSIVGLGLAHSPEGRRIFPRLTVEQNLLLGAFARRDGHIKKDLRRRMSSSLFWVSAAASLPAHSPAASNRCLRWVGP
jgi:branched-chain amino acid transport system ATP-binding protein